jgi:hypothetical protein
LKPLLEYKRIQSYTNLREQPEQPQRHQQPEEEEDEEWNHSYTDVEETTPLVQFIPLKDNNSSHHKNVNRMLKSVSALSLTGLEDYRIEICDLYTQYYNLKLFAVLNATAVRKILKKYDKTLHTDLKNDAALIKEIASIIPHYATDGQQQPGSFEDINEVALPQLDEPLHLLEDYYTHFYATSREDAKRKLKLMVRELVSYQRHTVWLDIIQNQRQVQNATIVKSTMPTTTTTQLSVKNLMTIVTQNYSTVAFLTCTIVFSLLLLGWKPSSDENDNNNIALDDDTTIAQHNAFALLVYVSLLWATEVRLRRNDRSIERDTFRMILIDDSKYNIHFSRNIFCFVFCVLVFNRCRIHSIGIAIICYCINMSILGGCFESDHTKQSTFERH